MQATYLSHAGDKTEWKNPTWDWDLVLRTRKQECFMKNNSEVTHWKNEEWIHINIIQAEGFTLGISQV